MNKKLYAYKMVGFLQASLLGGLLFITFTSCTKEARVDRYALLDMAKKVDKSVTPLIAKDLKSGVRCMSETGIKFYGDGCVGAFQVKVGPIDMITLEFDSYQSAEREAKRLGQWQYKNWVFDDVSGEPFLEDFVKKAFPGAIDMSKINKEESK